MAITQAVLQTALQSSRVAGIHPFGGVTYIQLASSVASAVALWAVGNPTNLSLEGSALGTSGVGVIVPTLSKYVLLPNVGVMMQGLISGGLNGPLALSLATAMTTGLVTAFNVSGQYSGISPFVGVGTDRSTTLVVNRATLIALLSSQMGAMMGPGPASLNMATGLGNGIANLFLTGIGTGAVQGTPSVPPTQMTGKTLSVVF